MSEQTYRRETDAHEARRELIARGVPVSLIAYDPTRALYVYDIESGDSGD